MKNKKAAPKDGKKEVKRMEIKEIIKRIKEIYHTARPVFGNDVPLYGNTTPVCPSDERLYEFLAFLQHTKPKVYSAIVAVFSGSVKVLNSGAIAYLTVLLPSEYSKEANALLFVLSLLTVNFPNQTGKDKNEH